MIKNNLGKLKKWARYLGLFFVASGLILYTRPNSKMILIFGIVIFGLSFLIREQ